MTAFLVTNTGNAEITTRIVVEGGPSLTSEARIAQLHGELDEVNTADATERVVPRERTIRVEPKGFDLMLPPRSFTTVRFRREPVGR